MIQTLENVVIWSVLEAFRNGLHTDEVTGSHPVSPTETDSTEVQSSQAFSNYLPMGRERGLESLNCGNLPQKVFQMSRS